ncbi:MAG: hypothetical protein ABMA13_02275 [Chthoniobacteraceae bacterium]
MDYRLLVDLEALAVLDGMPKRTRKSLLEHFVRLRSTPDRHSDFHEQDRIGRRVEISVFAGYAIHYWIDFADRHIKVLAIKPADRQERTRPSLMPYDPTHPVNGDVADADEIREKFDFTQGWIDARWQSAVR